ncbi:MULTISPECIES: GntR family transcriptional regulator [Burkholderia]|uniref:GntR family transcriptional regulator n=1 Tax=Burkholderia TaxID=32008 RepID=UPI00078CB1DD|nr:MULTISPECIES: FCD domain-containing protein [Burkholderia]AMU04674.1 GntR family transcriptional regulator [Burkholderia cenocepacia]RQS24175.1 FCD domain-containing protein [Burkholderia sp. Bp8995]RQS38904.1 FCD domain-containing protein [Burkholderia sp. Bp8989]
MDLETSGAAGKSLTTTAFELIRADVLMGKLLPSERLRVQVLSERYGIGATAIREALSRLVTEGLVDVEDQRGFCVTPVSREALLDLTETRIGVERLALSRSILHGDVEWETNMVSAYHRLSRTPVPTDPAKHQAWATVHRQFHEALIGGCASPWLQRLCRLLYDQAERYRNLAELEMRTAPDLRDTFAEHKALLDAALERDIEKLSALIGVHFRTTTEIILKAGFDRSST